MPDKLHTLLEYLYNLCREMKHPVFTSKAKDNGFSKILSGKLWKFK